MVSFLYKSLSKTFMDLAEENYWRGYIDAKVEDMGKVRMYHPSVEQKEKKRDELLAKHNITL